MHVVCGAEPSPFSNDCNSWFTLHASERSYRSATTRMDLCQLVSVTSEWCCSDHINSITFLKLVFQINRHKVKWGSSLLHTMSNSDSHIGLLPPSISVLLAQLTHVRLVHQGCWTIASCRVVLSRMLTHPEWLKSSKELFSDNNLNEF